MVKRCGKGGQRLLNLNHDHCVGLDLSPARRFVSMPPVGFCPLDSAGRGNPKVAEKAFTANLSETGLFIVTRRKLKIGTAIGLMLRIGGSTARMQGEVVWIRRQDEPGRPAGVGVRLLDPPASYRTSLLNQRKQITEGIPGS